MSASFYLQNLKGSPGSRESSAALYSPAAPSNFGREPKYVLFDLHNTLKIQLEISLFRPQVKHKFRKTFDTCHQEAI